MTKLRLRFNRYMVECKLNDLPITTTLFLVLIDTWWNVNIYFCGFV